LTFHTPHLLRLSRPPSLLPSYISRRNTKPATKLLLEEFCCDMMRRSTRKASSVETLTEVYLSKEVVQEKGASEAQEEDGMDLGQRKICSWGMGERSCVCVCVCHTHCESLSLSLSLSPLSVSRCFSLSLSLSLCLFLLQMLLTLSQCTDSHTHVHTHTHHHSNTRATCIPPPPPHTQHHHTHTHTHTQTQKHTHTHTHTHTATPSTGPLIEDRKKEKNRIEDRKKEKSKSAGILNIFVTNGDAIRDREVILVCGQR